MMFAAIPLVFGAHQLLEGVIWGQLEDSGQAAVRTPAVEAWLLIAWVLLPVYVPLAVRRFEPDARRRAWMLGLAVVGAATGALLAVESVVAEVSVSASPHHLQYSVAGMRALPVAFPYVAATCGPLLVSSHRFVVRFGLALLAAMAVTAVLDARAFSSVWCFFAALLSTGLFVHYSRLRSPALGLPPS